MGRWAGPGPPGGPGGPLAGSTLMKLALLALRPRPRACRRASAIADPCCTRVRSLHARVLHRARAMRCACCALTAYADCTRAAEAVGRREPLSAEPRRERQASHQDP